MKVAVLLAAYNGELWIEEQVKSILHQKKVEVFLYISVDESTDNTLNIVKRISEEDQRVKILSPVPRMGSAGKNFFRLIMHSEVSDFDYVAFADQDDIWLEDKLLKAIELMVDSGADAYSSNATAFWEDGKEILLRKSFSQTDYDYFFEAAGPGCTYVLSNKIFIDVKNFICLNFEKVCQIDLHDWFLYSFQHL